MRNRIMHLIKWLTVIALLMPTIASAQVGFNPTDEEKVGLILNELQQGLQRARVGDVELPLVLTFFADGIQTDSASVVATINALLVALPPRDAFASNPLPAKFGVFWDFQITDPSLQFDADLCQVTCGYSLHANGVRTSSGRIDLAKIGRGYRIVRLDGLLPFLNAELTIRKAAPYLPRDQKGLGLKKKR